MVQTSLYENGDYLFTMDKYHFSICTEM